MRITTETRTPAIAAGLQFTSYRSESRTTFTLALDRSNVRFNVVTGIENDLHEVVHLEPDTVLSGSDVGRCLDMLEHLVERPLGNASFAIPVRSTPGAAAAPMVASVAREAAAIYGRLAPLASTTHRYRIEVQIRRSAKVFDAGHFDASLEIEAATMMTLDRHLDACVREAMDELRAARVREALVTVYRLDGDGCAAVRFEPFRLTKAA